MNIQGSVKNFMKNKSEKPGKARARIPLRGRECMGDRTGMAEFFLGEALRESLGTLALRTDGAVGGGRMPRTV